MQAVPDDAAALMALVFVLGCRHGLDPDHLATIDGLTRFNALMRPRLSRWSGVFFSLGHGLVVTIAAAVVAQLSGDWSMPSWLEFFGVWISIGLLLALGVGNLMAVFRAHPHELVAISGVKAHLLRGFTRISHPVLIASVGALFALSFDTLSQAAVFSLAATRLAGWLFAALAGVVFMLGMITTDGLNGVWMAHLLRRADRRARVASRAMSLAVGALSFVIALYGMARYLAPAWLPSDAGVELAGGVAVLVVMAASFAVAMRLAGPLGSATMVLPRSKLQQSE